MVYVFGTCLVEVVVVNTHLKLAPALGTIMGAGPHRRS